MAEHSEPAKLTTRCTHCGTTFHVAATHVGKQARCRQCGEVFRVEPTTETATPQTTAGSLCPVCQMPISPEERFDCPDCSTAHHQACWEYNQGCGMYGCPQSPPTEPLESLEVPASYWGQEEKECPSCHQVILAAAVRCRYCGTIFSSARPEDTREFYARTRREKNLPAVRRHGVILLIFSVLSCSAPLAALIGVPWYARHKQEINSLPALYAAIPKIAIVIALAQTLLVIIMAILYAAFRG